MWPDLTSIFVTVLNTKHLTSWPYALLTSFACIAAHFDIQLTSCICVQSVVTYLAAKGHFRFGGASDPEERKALRLLLADVGLANDNESETASIGTSAATSRIASRAPSASGAGFLQVGPTANDDA